MAHASILDRRTILGPVLTALAYFCAAFLSMELTRNTDGLGTIWPASGILLAALLVVSRDRTAAYVLTAGIASFAANILAAGDTWTAIVFSLANMAEALVAVRLCRATIDGTPDMTDPRHVGRLCMATVAAATTSATLAGALSGDGVSVTFVTSWFATVSLGMLVVTPLVLTAWTMLRSVDRVRVDRSVLETATLLGMVALVSVGVFAQSTYPLLFLPMLAQLAATYRLGAFGAAAGVLVIASVASVATATGSGPLMLIVARPAVLMVFLQCYLLALLASALPLATLLAKRDALMRQLRVAHGVSQRTAALATAAADTDHLTGLASRRRILAHLGAALVDAGRTGLPVSIAILDIDHFKGVNDRHGHLAGDDVLRRVAGAIRSVLRTGDMVGRFGGEEFLIVFAAADTGTAMGIAERVRGAVAASTPDDPAAPMVTTSIGVAIAGPGQDADAMIEQADRALYAAKAAGRNSVRLAA